jgi:DNA repair exonuclease SbcCD ATPase subunit
MDKIKTIAHLSDIHIRKLHRFVEYREVFSRLYVKLEQLKPDLIYVGGDIVHGKLDTSPEETRLLSSFFLNLTKIADTVVITGNHDVNLQNRSREDALSPVIDLVKRVRPNLYYWKKSGKYTLKNIDFGVLSIFDIDKNGQQLVNKLPNPTVLENEHKIALHHGPVDTFVFDNGFSMTNNTVTGGTFNGYDLVLLGDIHKRQFLNEEKTIGYCGSLIQQGFAEDPDHGILVWDVETKQSTYHTIENDYGFKTIQVVDGVVQNKMDFVPPKGFVRIKYWNTTLEEIKDIQMDLYKKYPKLKDVKSEKQDTLSALDKGIRSNKIDIGDVRDVKYQNQLIKEFLRKNIEDIDEKTVDRVCNINEVTNNTPEIYDSDIGRNVSWKLKSFEFDNMFSYKEGNKIDFDKMHGVVGLVAPNHSGKSAMLDSVAYTIFDTCSRTFKALDVLNKRKQNFKAKLNLEINGEDYWIERKGQLKTRKSRKTGEVTHMCPVSVKFYMVEDGQNVDLTGAARRNSQYGGGTNEEIRKLLGTFDDFILTSLSLQTSNTNFVDKKQFERKQILCQFMDINIFDQLYDIARDDSNEERVLLKTFQKKTSYTELATIEQKIVEQEKNKNITSNELKDKDKKINEIEVRKLKLIKQLHKIEDWDDNISNLEEKLSQKRIKKEKLLAKLDEDKDYKETLRPLYLEYHNKLDNLDEEKIKQNYEVFQNIMYDLNGIENKIESTKTEIYNTESLIEQLTIYKYDPSCKFCLKNGEEHINHMSRAQQTLQELFRKREELNNQLLVAEQQKKNVIDAVEEKDEYDRFTEEINQISQDAIKIGGTITTVEEKIKVLKKEIEAYDNKVAIYYESEQKIKNNQDINERISRVVERIETIKIEKEKSNSTYNNTLTQLAVLKTQKESIERDIKKLFDIEQKILDYDLYMMAVSKDGIPYELISRTIPSIELEVNQVLDNMMVGFTLKLEMEGKNINTYICYPDQQWPLELASGMERFVSGLAMRIGLINISTLPRPNFLCLDEGFGSLDGENIANIQSAFDYLKTQFDFILVITHLDSIKDYTDHLIPIHTDDGFSQIAFG